MTRKISQREAHRIKRRLDALERQEISRNNAWSSDYVGGVNISSVKYAESANLVLLARKLGHAVVCTTRDDVIYFYALRVTK